MTETEALLTSVLNCRRVDLVGRPMHMTASQRARYNAMKAKLAHGEPLQYIIGECDFMGITIKVDPRVLIPRPETEIMADLAIRIFTSRQNERPLKVLDLGTGSGCIAIALAKNLKDCRVTAIDVSSDALALAVNNAKANNVGRMIEFIQADMSEFLNEAVEKNYKYDLIISNPPYIPDRLISRLPADVQREPSIALNGGPDGLKFYGPIVANSYQLLNAGGKIFVEIGDGQRPGLEELFHRYPFYQSMRFHKDYVGTDRILSAEIKSDN